MIRILATSRARPTGSLEAVLERAVAEGAPESPWVVVEDDLGEWVRVVGRMPAEDRALGIVAVASEVALVTAARLGVGGALWLPPSLSAAAAALEAAARPPAIRSRPDAWLADLVASINEECVAVTWTHRAFWRCQLGEPVMATMLASLAEALEALPALLPWPALLMRPRPVEPVHEAWNRVTRDHQQPSEGLQVVACDRRQGHCGVVTAAMRALAAADAREREVDPASWAFPLPVYELPSGRRIGWWSPRELDFEPPEREWLAVPLELSQAGFRWRLRDAGQPERWAEDAIELTDAPAVAVRVPGWIAGELSQGRPAGLLIERLATVADRLGFPLWVPNVRPDSLQLLLRMPGSLWVDGPVVPTDG